jgi:hypothetical protein
MVRYRVGLRVAREEDAGQYQTIDAGTYQPEKARLDCQSRTLEHYSRWGAAPDPRALDRLNLKLST